MIAQKIGSHIKDEKYSYYEQKSLIQNIDRTYLRSVQNVGKYGQNVFNSFPVHQSCELLNAQPTCGLPRNSTLSPEFDTPRI